MNDLIVLIVISIPFLLMELMRRLSKPQDTKSNGNSRGDKMKFLIQWKMDGYMEIEAENEDETKEKFYKTNTEKILETGEECIIEYVEEN